MCDKKYWIWLQLCLGCGAEFNGILEEYSSPERLYSASLLDWKMSSSLTDRVIDKLTKYDLSDAEKVIEICDKNGYKIITFDDSEYPAKLRDLYNPPAVLYVDGALIDFERYAVISVVGTRKASTYGLRAAKYLCKGMAICNAVIISGGALGIDSAAHEGAMEAGGKTFAILGNGLGDSYLRANDRLRNRIKETGGALITEFPPLTRATKYTFPMRNRIISGLCDGLIVVEAGVKSGSLITANCAIDQGRDVYAIPASIFDPAFQGTNKLIDDGVYVATSPYTVLSQYKEKYETLDLSEAKSVYELSKGRADVSNKEQMSFENIEKDRAERVRIQQESLNLSGDELEVYNLLSSEFTALDDIIQNESITVSKALSALTMLEIKGVVESAAGKRYRLK